MHSAYVIFLSGTKDRIFLYLAIALCRSLRQFDKHTDIAAMTVNGMLPEEHKELLRAEGMIVWEEEPLLVPWGCWSQWKQELAKIQVWRHGEYDKLILLDADCFAVEDPSENFELPELTCKRGSISPLNSAKLALDPSAETYGEMREIIAQATFTTKTDWNEAGEFPHWLHAGRMSDWSFNGATHSQGFLFYYFDLLKKKVCYDGLKHFGHLAGGARAKLSRLSQPQYRARYQELGVYEQIMGLPWSDRVSTILTPLRG